MAASIVSSTASLRPVRSGKCISFVNDLGSDLEQGQMIKVEELVGIVSEYEVKAGEIGTLDLGVTMQIFEGPVASATEIMAGERCGLDASGNIVVDSDGTVVTGTDKLIALPQVDKLNGPVGGLNGTDDASRDGDVLMHVALLSV